MAIVQAKKFLNKGQGFIVIESDPGAIDKGISEMWYRGIILNMIWFCINYGSDIKAKSKMFAPNRHYQSIERKNTR